MGGWREGEGEGACEVCVLDYVRVMERGLVGGGDSVLLVYSSMDLGMRCTAEWIWYRSDGIWKLGDVVLLGVECRGGMVSLEWIHMHRELY